eukprot:scaffold86197_cov67-Phaeocystis_antarctica.AAC.1
MLRIAAPPRACGAEMRGYHIPPQLAGSWGLPEKWLAFSQGISAQPNPTLALPRTTSLSCESPSREAVWTHAARSAMPPSGTRLRARHLRSRSRAMCSLTSELPIGTAVLMNTAAPTGLSFSIGLAFARVSHAAGACRMVALFTWQKTGPASRDSIARCSVEQVSSTISFTRRS